MRMLIPRIRQNMLFFLTFVSSSVMGECIDVYGVDAKEGQIILKQYTPQLTKMMQVLYAGVKNDFDGFFNTPSGQQWREERRVLIEKIKAQHHYAHVDFDTTYYSKDEYCTTIEIVKSDEQERCRYLPDKREHHYPKTHDIMDVMQDYLVIGHQLFLSNQIQPKHAECPVYHCTMGFVHRKLKPYLERFNTAAVEDRQFILNTLKDDLNPTRRAAAAYLVGHFRDPHDIVDTLISHVEDDDEGVRNNVIRVLSLTTEKAHITDLNPTPFIHLLTSPLSTDRNKSLFLLSVLAESASTKRYLIQDAKTPLLNILRMQQPNQHDFAYEILKKISGQDFGSTNDILWENWFDKHQGLEPQDA